MAFQICSGVARMTIWYTCVVLTRALAVVIVLSPSCS